MCVPVAAGFLTALNNCAEQCCNTCITTTFTPPPTHEPYFTCCCKAVQHIIRQHKPAHDKTQQHQACRTTARATTLLPDMLRRLRHSLSHHRCWPHPLLLFTTHVACVCQHTDRGCHPIQLLRCTATHCTATLCPATNAKPGPRSPPSLSVPVLEAEVALLALNVQHTLHQLRHTSRLQLQRHTKHTQMMCTHEACIWQLVKSNDGMVSAIQIPNSSSPTAVTAATWRIMV